MNLYELLGLKKPCTKEEIIATKKKIAMKNHPDKTPGQKVTRKKSSDMAEITRALRILTDNELKDAYDSHRKHANGMQIFAEENEAENKRVQLEKDRREQERQAEELRKQHELEIQQEEEERQNADKRWIDEEEKRRIEEEEKLLSIVSLAVLEL
ncbi:unnamed protein product [Allacma fusca]|uniref:J domain-containing protein n=1 Tax=Allacma fusca TaxID=39272 RepID=A0A8J2JYA0_9HEXA|nr:unnamed protein product [Allacma fusca]